MRGEKKLFVSQFAGKKLRGKRKRRRDAEDGEGVAAPPQASAYDALLGSLSRANGGAEPIRRHLREREGDSEGSGGRGEDDAGSSGDDAQSAGSARAPVVARAVAGSAGDLAGTSEAVVGLCGEPPWQPEGAGEPTKDAIKDAQDALERHVSHVLADDEVAALAGPSGRAHAVEWGPGRGAEVAATWAPDAALRATRSRGSAEGPRMAARLRDMGVKERCVARWREEVLGGSAPAPGDTDFLTREQQALFALLRSFRDVVYPLYRYPDASRALGLPGRGCGGGPGDAVMDAVLLHIVDHVARSADTVRKNNAVAEEAKAAGRPLDEVPRDQGFVRTRALLLVPMRNVAYWCVMRLMALAQKETRADTYQGKARFLRDFGPDEDDAEGGAGAAGGRDKPGDFKALFHGNCDDHFAVGLKITRGAVKILWKGLEEADVVVASPLGVATALQESIQEKGEGKIDWLTSVEILVVARADVMVMQNWQHVETTMAALNQLPETQHGDIMRVREWALAGHARHYRQTVVLTSLESPEVAALAAKCANHAGCVRWAVQHPGVLGHVAPGVRQMFERLDADSFDAAPDARFRHFVAKVWPRIRDAGVTGQLLFVPSYFDFLRLRRFFKEEGVDVALASEYQDKRGFTRARTTFFQGTRRVMLYTERAHFYHRFRIRGVRDVVFYAIPEHEAFYPEILSMVETGPTGHGTVQALFSAWDALALRRLVGSKRADKMIKGEARTFMFC